MESDTEVENIIPNAIRMLHDRKHVSGLDVQQDTTNYGDSEGSQQVCMIY
jgi:hypothetical protein